MMNDLTLPSLSATSLADQIYEILREKILSKELEPGQRLNLGEISRCLHVSKTPIKEALNRLQLEGLIAIRPRSGTFVTEMDPRQISESFDLRRVLEIYAVELVIEHQQETLLEELRQNLYEQDSLLLMDDRHAVYPKYLSLDQDFHHRLVEMTGQQRLIQAYKRENIHAQMARVRYRSTALDLDTSLKEHKSILEAILAHDIDTARLRLDTHLRRAQTALLADIVGATNTYGGVDR